MNKNFINIYNDKLKNNEINKKLIDKINFINELANEAEKLFLSFKDEIQIMIYKYYLSKENDDYKFFGQILQSLYNIQKLKENDEKKQNDKTIDF